MDSQSEKTERKESRLQFNKQLFKTYLALDHWHRFRLRLFLEGILVGIAGGLLIALFRFLLGLADTYRRRLFQEIIIPSFRISDFLPLLWWLAALPVPALILALAFRRKRCGGCEGCRGDKNEGVCRRIPPKTK